MIQGHLFAVPFFHAAGRGIPAYPSTCSPQPRRGAGKLFGGRRSAAWRTGREAQLICESLRQVKFWLMSRSWPTARAALERSSSWPAYCVIKRDDSSRLVPRVELQAA